MYVGLAKKYSSLLLLKQIPSNYLRKMKSTIYAQINGYISISNEVGACTWHKDNYQPLIDIQHFFE